MTTTLDRPNVTLATDQNSLPAVTATTSEPARGWQPLTQAHLAEICAKRVGTKLRIPWSFYEKYTSDPNDDRYVLNRALYAHKWFLMIGIQPLEAIGMIERGIDPRGVYRTTIGKTTGIHVLCGYEAQHALRTALEGGPQARLALAVLAKIGKTDDVPFIASQLVSINGDQALAAISEIWERTQDHKAIWATAQPFFGSTNLPLRDTATSAYVRKLTPSWLHKVSVPIGRWALPRLAAKATETRAAIAPTRFQPGNMLGAKTPAILQAR